MTEEMVETGPVTEAEYLEDNIATVAFHLGQSGATMSVNHPKGGLQVDAGEVLAEISKRISTYNEQRKQLVSVQSTLRKVLHACNTPVSHRAEQVRSEIVGIISTHLEETNHG